MAVKIQVRRGSKAGLPKLSPGEFGFTTDTMELFIGGQSGNVQVASKDEVSTHINNKSNPHGVTKAQVGLGNVDNTSDENKPISTAVQNALNGKAPKYTYGTADLTPGVSPLAEGTLYFVYE